jgi:hypothetical protein
VEKRESMKQKKTIEQSNTKPEDDQKEEDEMDIMSQYMLQPVEGLFKNNLFVWFGWVYGV